MHDVEVIEMKDVVNRNRAAITHPSGHQHDRYDDHQFEIVCVGCGASRGEFNRRTTYDVVMEHNTRWLVIRQDADGLRSTVVCSTTSESQATKVQKALQNTLAARD